MGHFYMSSRFNSITCQFIIWAAIAQNAKITSAKSLIKKKRPKPEKNGLSFLFVSVLCSILFVWRWFSSFSYIRAIRSSICACWQCDENHDFSCFHKWGYIIIAQLLTLTLFHFYLRHQLPFFFPLLHILWAVQKLVRYKISYHSFICTFYGFNSK